ncbi:MAG TPA: glycosyltransferase family A protein [Variovorax sp.]|nr:glycosyltransferase family A protein [Variovorax sp.]
MPTYSIAMPVYRRTFGFREALASAVKVEGCQEILVVDDHSEHDEFERIVESCGSDKVRYLRNEANLGLFGNWNRGAELATGEFVSILCSDDIIVAQAYEMFAAAYRADPQLDVFFGSFCTFDEAIENAFTHRVYPAGPMDSLEFLARAVTQGAAFPVLTITRRAKLLERPFVAKPHSGNDWLWIYANASAFKLHAVAQPISYWRRHPDQDAVHSSAVTTDCWPMLYQQVAQQLRAANHPLAGRALRRAKGVVLSWLLNDYVARTGYFPRLRGAEAQANPFLRAALEMVRQDALLRCLLDSRPGGGVCREIGRVVRKIGYYPVT